MQQQRSYRDKEKKSAYKFLWGIVDWKMEELFTSIDGFWSSTTHEIYRRLSSHNNRKMFIGSQWVNLEQAWTCPICERKKISIGRVGKSGKIILDIVTHHDHSSDYLDCDYGRRTQRTLYAQRFDPITVCAECNVAEANVKGAIIAEQWFSFSPEEIRRFIDPGSNRKHITDLDVGRAIYKDVIEEAKERIAIAETLDGLEVDSFDPRANIVINSDSIQLLEVESGIDGRYLRWALDPRSRNHFFLSRKNIITKKGVFMPF